MKSIILALILLVGHQLIAQNLSFGSFGPASLKRGMTYQISWTAGMTGENVNLHLIDARGKVTSLGTIENSGSATVAIPSRTKPGRYFLRITSQSGSVTRSPETL